MKRTEKSEVNNMFQPTQAELRQIHAQQLGQLARTQAQIEQENRHFVDEQAKTELIMSQNVENIKLIDDLIDQSSKIKDDPYRIQKNSDMLKNAIDLLKKERDAVG